MWPTSAPFSAAFHVNRAAAFHRKAELLESLISVLRMHPNGQKPPNTLCQDATSNMP